MKWKTKPQIHAIRGNNGNELQAKRDARIQKRIQQLAFNLRPNEAMPQSGEHGIVFSSRCRGRTDVYDYLG
jgi:hypothetical protein